MPKIEEPKVTPERLMQFGFACAPPLIIGAATANKVFDTLASGAKNVEEVSRKNWSLGSTFARNHERAGRPRIAEEKRR